MATYDIKQIALPGGDIANLKDGNAIHKSNTSGFVKNDGSIDQNTYQIAQEGKGLSTNDYTTNEKNKLAGIAAGATKTASSTTNGNIKINDVETQVYDDSEIQGKIDTTTTSISGNPISISGLKSNQLAVNPIITYNPIQDLHGQSKPYPAGGGKNKLNMSDRSMSQAGWLATAVNVNLPAGKYTFSCNLSGTGASGQFQLFNNGTEILRPSFNFVNGLTTTTFTCSQDVDTINLWSNATGSFSKFQIESGESYTSYAPYENICPISGYDKIEVLSGGVNLLDKTKAIANERWNTSGTVSYTGSSRSIPIRVKPNTVYYFKNVYGTSNMAPIWWLDANRQYVAYADVGAGQTNSGTATSPANACYVGVNFPSTNIDTVLVSEGQAIDYVPYVKTTSISESLGQTVYKGELDVRTGIFTSRYALVDMGSLNWQLGSTLYADLPLSSIAWFSHVRAICSCYPWTTTIPSSVSGIDDKSFVLGTTYAYVYIKDTSYSDANVFKNAMTGQKLCYELATPFEIQLTPHEISLLKDYAYLSTNGTSIALDYHNGELASLSDVSQLNETFELLNRPPVRKDSINIKNYTTENNAFTCPCDGYIFVRLPSGSGHVLMRLMDSLGNVVGTYTDAADAEESKAYSVFVKRGIKTYAYCYVGETLEYTYWFYGIV